MQRRFWVVIGVALAAALALWAWRPANQEPTRLARGEPQAAVASAPSPASLGQTAAASQAAQPAHLVEPTRAVRGSTVPVTVVAPQQLQVGEIGELVFRVDASRGVGEVGFTMLFDPNTLQARFGTEGDWSAGVGLDARTFLAEISEEGDRAQIRSMVSGERGRMAGDSVAIVSFQALAAGPTFVTITDVVVKDLAGRPMAPAIAASNLQITVNPAPPPGAWRQRLAPSAEPPSATGEAGN